jgi:hypothetical protein
MGDNIDNDGMRSVAIEEYYFLIISYICTLLICFVKFEFTLVHRKIFII